MRKFVIGRVPDCDLVVNHAGVSSRHASIFRDERGLLILKDEHSSNGTYLNSPEKRVAEMELRDTDVVLFSQKYRVPASVLVAKFLEWEQHNGEKRSVLAMGQVYRLKEYPIVLGSARSSNVVLPFLGVWPFHAQIVRDPAGLLVLQDMGGGTLVDGVQVTRRARTLQAHSMLVIGGVLVSVSYDQASGVVTIGTERRGFYLHAKNLSYLIHSGKARRALLDDVSFSILPGELVGLLGPSGSGKTTLLTCLCGVQFADGVYFNGAPLRQAAASCTNVIGYVPQDDVLYPELTVRETLFWSARLRLDSHTSNERIHEKISEVCSMLGLVDKTSGLDLLDTIVGSPEHRTLSGGQRKRVNLALELLTDPLILFLDEPTSGLSSQDTRMVMSVLRRIADEKGISIVVTIHQPSQKVYAMFDQTLYLKTGKLVWFGPAHPGSARHFLPKEVETDPEDIMEVVDSAETTALQTRFQRSPYEHRFVQERGQLIESLTKGGDLAVPQAPEPLGHTRQYWHLLRRQLTRRWRDRAALGVQLGQAPVLGALLGWIFIENRINTPLFLLVFISIWFGANASARELVSERMLFRREKRGGVSVAATLLSKLTAHSLILLVQCLLLFFVADAIVDFDASPALVLPIMWMSGICGTTLGFVVSAIARTEIFATLAVPLVLIPILLFGGSLTPYDEMSLVKKGISNVMPSRWGYEAMVQAEKLVHVSRPFEEDSSGDPKDFINFNTKAKGREYSDPAWRRMRIWICMGVLLGQTALLGAYAWLRLKWVN